MSSETDHVPTFDSDETETHISKDDLEKYGKHLKEWEELREIEEKYMATSSDLLQTRESVERLEEEIRQVQQYRQEMAERHESLYLSARRSNEMGDHEAALDTCLKILEENSHHLRAERLKKWLVKRIEEKEIATIETERLLAFNHKKVQELYIEARKSYVNHQFEKALGAAEEALVLKPDHHDLKKLRDECMDRLREIEQEMQKASRTASERLQNSTEALINARKLRRENKYAETLELLEDALKKDAENISLKEELHRYENEWLKISKEKESESELTRAREKKQEILHRCRQAYYSSSWDLFMKTICELDENDLDDSWNKKIEEVRQKIADEEQERKTRVSDENTVMSTCLHLLNQERMEETLEYLEKATAMGLEWSNSEYSKIISKIFDFILSEKRKKIQMDEYNIKMENQLKVMIDKINILKQEKNWKRICVLIQDYVENYPLNTELKESLDFASTQLRLQEEETARLNQEFQSLKSSKEKLWFSCLESEYNEEFDRAHQLLNEIIALDPLDMEIRPVLIRILDAKRYRKKTSELLNILDERIKHLQQEIDTCKRARDDSRNYITGKQYDKAISVLESCVTHTSREP